MAHTKGKARIQYEEKSAYIAELITDLQDKLKAHHEDAQFVQGWTVGHITDLIEVEKQLEELNIFSHMVNIQWPLLFKHNEPGRKPRRILK